MVFLEAVLKIKNIKAGKYIKTERGYLFDSSWFVLYIYLNININNKLAHQHFDLARLIRDTFHACFGLRLALSVHRRQLFDLNRSRWPTVVLALRI